MGTTRYLMANWKMYATPRESVVLARAYAKAIQKMPRGMAVVAFPSALAIPLVTATVGKKLSLGAQNTYAVAKGGATGEVSADMFHELGCRYALVGHSERRHLFHETNHDVRLKIEACLAAGLTPVLCVGETRADQQNGVAEEVIESQIRSAYTGLSWPKKTPLIIAYEPVWAISHGTSKKDRGDVCLPEQAEKINEMIVRFAKALLKGSSPAVLYGGSVRAETVRAYLAMPNISGVLVGASSTKAGEWAAIVKNSLSA